MLFFPPLPAHTTFGQQPRNVGGSCQVSLPWGAWHVPSPIPAGPIKLLIHPKSRARGPTIWKVEALLAPAKATLLCKTGGHLTGESDLQEPLTATLNLQSSSAFIIMTL